MRDEKGADEKILARVAHDPRYSGVRTLAHLPTHVLREVEHFFDVYKTLEKKPVAIGEWKDVDVAQQMIENCRLIRNPGEG
jgi:inorganic pyrophosphatase